MKAIQLTAYGGTDNLAIRDVDPPEPKNNQVLVAVSAASINPFDRFVREGHMKEKAPLILPFTPGGDFSGVVTKANSDAPFAVGDEIYGQAQILSGASGAFAYMATANNENCAHKPKTATFEEAAALPLVGSSAVQALEDHAHLQQGQKILIHGGAGGIGHIAIQLAKSIGAFVATTVSSRDIDFAKKMGADVVIDFTTQAFETMLKDYDVVFDTVGGEVMTKSFMVLKQGGILVSMKGQPDETLAKTHHVTGIGQVTKTNTARLSRVATLVDEGKIHVHIDKTFPFVEIANAWKLQDTGHPRGKIVITMDRV